MKQSLERAKRGTCCCEVSKTQGCGVLRDTFVQSECLALLECRAEPCEPVMTDSLPTKPKSLKTDP